MAAFAKSWRQEFLGGLHRTRFRKKCHTVLCRRRHQPRRPPLAKIRPASTALWPSPIYFRTTREVD
jgi:hypothetical protein